MSPTLKKLVKRTALLAAVGFVISQMLPSLADQLTPNSAVDTATATAAAEPSASPVPSDTPTSSSAPTEPKADVTYLPSETPTIKAKVIDSPSLIFRIPNSLRVDPRATSVRLDSLALGGAAEVLVCLTSSRANISFTSFGKVLTSGQGTHEVLVSGPSADVLASLTSGQGTAFNAGGRISGSTLLFRVGAVNKPTVDSALCEDAQISRSLTVTALGIDLNTVKAPVNMGKK